MKTYKLNNIDVPQSEILELLKNNPELLKGEEKKWKFFSPKNNDVYYYLNSGNYNYTINTNCTDKDTTNRGVYQTEAEAELADKKRLALVRLWNYADEHMYFRPDWHNHNESKFFPVIDNAIDDNINETKLKTFVTCYICWQFILPYFKSQE